MRVTSRESATANDGKAIDDPAMTACGMTPKPPTAELSAKHTILPPGAVVS